MDKKILPIFYERLTTFPFIEKDFDSLTEYELLQALFAKVNECVDFINELKIDTTNFATKEYVNSQYAILNTKIDSQINGVIEYSDEKNRTLEKRINDKISDLYIEIQKIILGNIQDVENVVTAYGTININSAFHDINDYNRLFAWKLEDIDSVLNNSSITINTIDSDFTNLNIVDIEEANNLEYLGFMNPLEFDCITWDYYNGLFNLKYRKNV